MFALIAAVIAAVAWALIVIGDGIANPWAWLFATLFFIGLHLVYEFWPGPTGGWRRGP